MTVFHQYKLNKNFHCLSGGNKIAYSTQLTVRPKPNEVVQRPKGVNFGDFVEIIEIF